MKTAWLSVAMALTLSGAAWADDAPADIWKARCKGCHGDDGKAKTKIGVKEKVPDFTTAAWQAEMKDSEIRQVIAEGSTDNAKMKAFKEKLSAAEINSLVQYIRGLRAK